jgi:predicted MPP superfamily phosphohydrolase
MRRKLIIMLLVLGIAVTAVSAWRDTTTVLIREVDVPVPGLTRDVTLLHVSDLHGVRFGSGQADVAAVLGDRDFDAVVINGDHVAGFDTSVQPALELLAVLQDRAPIVIVSKGNHDTDEVIDTLTLHGAVPMRREDPGVQFAADAGRIVAVSPDRVRTVDGADAVIAVSHFPLTDDACRPAAADPTTTQLYLFGHTHGGQVRLPIVGALWAPGPTDAEGMTVPRDDETNFFPEMRGRTLQGLSASAGGYVHISAGLGTQGIRLRCSVRPT